MPTDSPPAKAPASPEQHEESTRADRERLEIAKLRLEIAQLAAPWWRRPTFMLAALPTVLAMLTLIYGLSNGYFQAQATKLENERYELQRDIAKFTQERDSLQTQLDALRSELQKERIGAKSERHTRIIASHQARRAGERIELLEETLRQHGVAVPP